MVDKKVETIGIMANIRKPNAPQVLDRLRQQAHSLGLHAIAIDETAKLLPGLPSLSAADCAGVMDVLVALGGDGTVLHAVHAMGPEGPAILGVNMGNLGFMTSVPESEMEVAIDALAQGNYIISERSLAECMTDMGKGDSGPFYALNDIVVGWGDSPRAVRLELAINGEVVAISLCDGAIVSTPTGSTGHSLSAGGPILHPLTPALSVTFICAHSLSSRPLVVPDKYEILLRVVDSPKRLILAIDGRATGFLETGAKAAVKRCPRNVRLVNLPGHSYFALLRQKLHWRGSSL